MCFRYIQSLLIVISLIIFIGISQAAEFTVNPSLSLRGEYNDNIDFSRTNEQDDYIGTISPGLALGYSTALFNLEILARVDFLRYNEYTNRNTERQNYGLTASYQAFERLTINAIGSYTRDTTLDYLLEETGIVERRSDRDSYSAGGGISYRASEQSDISANYTFTDTDYDLDEYTDSKEHLTTLSYSYAFNNRMDTVSISPYWRKTDSEVDEVNSYGISLGLMHQFTQTLSTNIEAGARYTETENDAGETDDDWGWTADVSLTKTWQTASISLGYTRDLFYTARGENIEVDRFSLTASKMVTEKLGIGLSGSLYFTEYTEEDRELRFYIISPSIFYNFTQNHSLELAYSYANEFDEELENYRERDRNMVWLTLNFSFPKTW